jgi:hypothetical protein
VHVHPVEDQFRGHALVPDGGDDGPRAPVPDPWHRVERVREQPGAAVEGRLSLLLVGLRVAHRDDDARFGQGRDGIERARQFRCDRDLPQRPARGRGQPLGDAGGRADEEVRVVCPPPARREERPFEVGAEHERVPLRQVRDRRERALKRRDRVRDEAQHRAGRPVRAVRRQGALNRRCAVVPGAVVRCALALRALVRGSPAGGGVVEAEAATAVDVQVDEARRQHRPRGVHHVGARDGVRRPARAVAGRGDPVTGEDHPGPVGLAVDVTLASPVHDDHAGTGHAGTGETLLHAHVLTNRSRHMSRVGIIRRPPGPAACAGLRPRRIHSGYLRDVYTERILTV